MCGNVGIEREREWKKNHSCCFWGTCVWMIVDPFLLGLVSFKLVVYPCPVSLLQKRKYLKRGITWYSPWPAWPPGSALYNLNTSHWAWSPLANLYFCLCWQLAVPLFSLSLHPFLPLACSAASKYLISCSANFWSWVCSHLGKCTWIMEAAWSEAGASLLHSVVLKPDKALHLRKRASESWWEDVWRYYLYYPQAAKL